MSANSQSLTLPTGIIAIQVPPVSLWQTNEWADSLQNYLPIAFDQNLGRVRILKNDDSVLTAYPNDFIVFHEDAPQESGFVVNEDMYPFLFNQKDSGSKEP